MMQMMDIIFGLFISGYWLLVSGYLFKPGTSNQK